MLNINDAGPVGGQDIFGFGGAFQITEGVPEGVIRDGQPFFIPRRHRGVGQ